jgi:hypothetical protein
MKLERIEYSKLNAKQQEQHNYHKVTSLLADFGYAGLLLADDYEGADFFAMHKDGGILKVQLKSRVTISRKYIGKDLYIAFPIKDRWCLIPHDVLLKLPAISVWLQSRAWIDTGNYHSPHNSRKLVAAVTDYLIPETA